MMPATSRRASACVAKLGRSISSISRVAKKLSHSAFSRASPTEPTDYRISTLRQSSPKAVVAPRLDEGEYLCSERTT